MVRRLLRRSFIDRRVLAWSRLLDRCGRELRLLFDGLDLVSHKSYIVDPMTNGKPNTKPGEKYEIDDKTIARLHGNA